ncbi:MAG: c-type cytochrome [Nitrospirae bacterium]|nr:c-type cytochrome [Nitrospirota bacterium]
MEGGKTLKSIVVVGITCVGLSLAACGEEGPPQPPPPAPPEYADKHMPEGHWGNPEIIEAGKQIFIGAENIDVNCASCHGKDGKPVKAGARDFRRTAQMEMYSDAVWFWRVNEGVKGTKMKAWKSKLSEEDIWKVIAYESTFGLKGKEWDPSQKKWVAHGMAGLAPAEGAESAAPAEGAPESAEPAEGAPESAAPAEGASESSAPAGE